MLFCVCPCVFFVCLYDDTYYVYVCLYHCSCELELEAFSRRALLHVCVEYFYTWNRLDKK